MIKTGNKIKRKGGEKLVTKKFIFVGILALILCGHMTAHAVPTLQLDIGGGVYDPDPISETIVSQSIEFSLYALLTTDDADRLVDTYYISAALMPAVSIDTNLGSFSFNGNTINITSDMIYGTPPIEAVSDATSDGGDLGPHGVFPTYFAEFAFKFDSLQKVKTYNSQDDPGGIDLNSSGGTYYVPFLIDTSNLGSGYVIHFDLYNTKVGNGSNDFDVDDFAPFSHDAESKRVPEPATMLLLGTGLIGLAGIGRKKFFKKG